VSKKRPWIGFGSLEIEVPPAKAGGVQERLG
jgi:hypothetical protein